MGIYTDFVIGCHLKAETPDEIIFEFRDWLGFQRDSTDVRPSPQYYDALGASIADATNGYISCSFEQNQSGSYYLSLRTTIKSYYVGSIDEFLIRLAPYNDHDGYVGYTHHEFDENPLLIFFQKGKAFYRKLEQFTDRQIVLP